MTSTDTLELAPPTHSRSPTPAPSPSGSRTPAVVWQATQPLHVPEYIPDPNIWGYLMPDGRQKGIIPFQRWKPTYRFGRSKEVHDIDEVIPDMCISELHCEIEWDPQEEEPLSVKIHDYSSNGTYINRVRIGKGMSRILHDRDQVAFATWEARSQGQHPLAYTFHLVAPWQKPTHKMYEKYQVRGGELGKGAFGSVVKALNMAEDKWYAIKIIQHEKREPATEASDTIMREVAVMQRVGHHRHICHLKEFFAEEYELALVLELVHGGNLKSYMNKIRPRPMSEANAQYLTYQICEALVYIHTQEIVHRDLKPENVLLTAHDPPVVKVADFGLARVMDGGALFQTKCGTPGYVAPEVGDQSAGGYDVLVDSWSLGVIIFQMLTLRVPFDTDYERTGSSRAFVPIHSRPITWDALEARGISPEGQAFLRGLLERDPQDRMAMKAARDHAWLSDVRSLWPADSQRDLDISDAFRAFLGVVPVSNDEAAESTSRRAASQDTSASCADATTRSADGQRSRSFSLGALQLGTLTVLDDNWVPAQTRPRSPSDDDEAGTRRATKRPRISLGDGATLTKGRWRKGSTVELGDGSSPSTDNSDSRLGTEREDVESGSSATERSPIQGADEGHEEER